MDPKSCPCVQGYEKINNICKRYCPAQSNYSAFGTTWDVPRLEEGGVHDTPECPDVKGYLLGRTDNSTGRIGIKCYKGVLIVDENACPCDTEAGYKKRAKGECRKE